MAIEVASEEQVQQFLQHCPGWQTVHGKLHREYRFADFAEAFAFMARVALVAEKTDHHPEWFNVYNRVIVDLVTHEAGGISERDFALAQTMDRFSCSG